MQKLQLKADLPGSAWLQLFYCLRISDILKEGSALFAF